MSDTEPISEEMLRQVIEEIRETTDRLNKLADRMERSVPEQI